LVHPKIIEVDKKTVKKNDPKRGTDKIKTEAAQAEFAIAQPDVDDLTGTAVDPDKQQIQDKQPAKCQEDSLDHLGPDHCFHTAKYGINNDTYAHDQHSGRHINTRQCLETQRNAKKDGSHAGDLRKQEARHGIGACPGPEAMF